MVELGVCPKCGYRPKPFQFPRTSKQFWWGGWTCPSCNSEIDRKGNITKEGNEEDSVIFREEYLKEKARLKALKENKDGRRHKKN